MGKVLIKDKIDISQISQLDEKNLRYLEILGEGGFGIVRKAYDIQQTIFLAIKYLKMDKSKTVIEEIAGEDFLLEKINQIKSPSLLQYYGLQKDPKSEGNLVLVMESGETTLENLLKQNLRFNQNELLYILYDLTNQLLLLQRNGICNRDIKPDNFIIVKNPENGKYSFKIADFGIGCYIESKDKYLIPISDFSTCTPKFASPEAMKIFEDEYDDFNYYDPFLSDVYSLAKSFQFMMDPTQNNSELKEILELMLVEQVQKRISLFKLQDKLKEKKFQNIMKSPDQIMGKYISQWKANKDKGTTLKEKLQKYQFTFQLYSDIAHFKEAEEFAIMIEEKITENERELEQNKSYEELMANIYNMLALFYQNVKQNYNRAEIFFEKSLILFKKMYGEENASTAALYNNLAIFYEKVCQKYDKAEEYYEKSLQIRKKVLGEEHPSTAQSYNNIAFFYQNVRQKYDKTEEYHEKCLKIYKKVLGEENSDTASSYNNLAIFYQNVRQKYDKAEEYYEKSLQIRKKVLGEEHPETAISYNNMALFYQNVRQKYDKTEEYYEKSLQIRKKVLGEEHPDTAQSYNNIAFFYQNFRQKYDNAEEYYEKCLKIRRKVLGEEHPDTATSSLNFGKLIIYFSFFT